LRAGAHSTVLPSKIGGLRMASELIRPHVVNFLDLLLKEQSHTLRVEQLEISGPPWAGRLLKDLYLQDNFNLLVLAVKSDGRDQMAINPPATVMIQPGDTVILLGDMADIQRAREIAEPAASLAP
jgi:voltage-gated potassium channel